MKYHLLSAVLIGAAVVLELSGYANARSDFGAALFTAGAACELWFWIRLGASKKKTGQGDGQPTQLGSRTVLSSTSQVVPTAGSP